VLVGLGVAAGCASTAGPVVPARPGAAHPAAERVVSEDHAFMGVAYRPGGTRPAGFDCSGFVQYLYRQQGNSLPRTTQAQVTAGTCVTSRRILPGDLVFFRISGRRISHVGISLGDGRFMHAPNVGSHVRIDRLEAPYWARRFAGVRRVAP
jgi:cell wall-associated NlpC family hydrolase